MRILIACEYSGTVRDAFIARGHDAMSCDLLPTEVAGPHYQGDVRDILDDGWDALIGHPECTYLTNSGVCHLHKDPSRWDRLDEVKLTHKSWQQWRDENPDDVAKLREDLRGYQ